MKILKNYILIGISSTYQKTFLDYFFNTIYLIAICNSLITFIMTQDPYSVCIIYMSTRLAK
mgnify:CR=1 FL=1